jgi:hypothetical protein
MNTLLIIGMYHRVDMDARFYCAYEPVLDTGQAKAAAYPPSIRLPPQRVYFIFYSTFGSQPQISTTQQGEVALDFGSTGTS